MRLDIKSTAMKTLLTSLILFLSLSASAQYYPFPTDSASWVNYCERYDNFDQWGLPIWYVNYVNNFCATGQDTVINAIDYKVISVCHANGGSYFGAIRYENGRVYYVPKEDTIEGLLYDFTLNPGQSADVLIIEPASASTAEFMAPFTMTITSVDTIIVNGTERRRLFTDYGAPWIEGIGCSLGLFSETWDNVSGYYIELRCMSYQDTTHVQNGQTLTNGVVGSCPMTVGLDDPLSLESWNIYPNPANDFIRITTESGESKEVVIYDASGRLVLSGYHTEEEIPIEGLENGIYYADMDGSTRLKFLVSE